ncbi:MAG: ABC transporter ATP-binding protein [Bdellovibrionales bacterium]
MSSLIQVKNLKVEFRTKELLVQAVRGVSLDIKAGETIGLVGESGSGKSVTALSLMQLISTPPGRITGGQILLEGKDLLKYSESEIRKIRGNRISMIFQEPMTSLNPVFTVGYQIAEALILHQNMNKKEAREKTIHLLDQVGIARPSDRVDSYPHEMSGGQRQRVMIAMAIGCQPDLLIADEPTTSLDVTIQKQILELLQGLQDQLKMSMLFISHDLGIVSQITKKVSVMYKGEIVEEGKTSEIFKNPQHPYTKGLVACRPTLDVKTARLPMISDFIEGKDFSKLPLKEIKKTKGKTLLEIKELKKHFPLEKSFFGKVKSWVKAVDGVSFKVEKGSTLGLVGESGCGKTTLGRTILRLVEPSNGSVLYDNIDVTQLNKKQLKEMRKKVQIIFQDPYASLNPRMTIGSSIMEPMIIHGLYSGKKERIQKVEELMKRVGLDKNMRNRYPHEFSGGQRQRICIARTLAVQPEFIICDESVSSLDVSIQAQILNLLKDLQDQLNLTYIFISHDLTVVKFISDRVAVMKEGQILEMNDAESIYQSPQHPYTKKLIDAIPSSIPKHLQ